MFVTFSFLRIQHRIKNCECQCVTSYNTTHELDYSIILINYSDVNEIIFFGLSRMYDQSLNTPKITKNSYSSVSVFNDENIVKLQVLYTVLGEIIAYR